MDLQSGAPYWLLADGLGPPVPPLDLDASCEVAIIGAGISGALVAWTLAQEGVDAVVIDRREVGLGSTVASTALLQYDLDVPLHELSGSIGWETAARAFRIGVEAIEMLTRIGEQIGEGVVGVPSLYVARTDSAAASLRAEYACRREAGLEVSWVGADALSEDWRLAARCAILSEAGGQLDPYAFTTALLADAIRRGARVHDRTAVVHIRCSDGGVTLATDRGATIRAKTVVHATGYEAARRLRAGMVSLSSTYAVATEPIQDADERPRCTLWEYADPYLYARWAGDRLLIGGEDVAFKDERRRDRLIAKKRDRLIRDMSSMMPDCELEPAFAWTGTFGSTADGLGYIGALPDQPRELFALGFGGNGITFSVLAARMLADRIMGRENPDADMFRLDRGVRRKAPGDVP